MYAKEQDLVDNFLERLLNENPWESLKFGTEFNYTRGRTDIVTVSLYNEVIAVEAKLSKWRSALQQAYRNRCFADKSYILLPYDIAKIACMHEHEFDKRGVGICSIKDGVITILKEAFADEPLQPWLHQLAFQYAMKGKPQICRMNVY